MTPTLKTRNLDSLPLYPEGRRCRAPAPTADRVFDPKLIYGHPLHCKHVFAFGIRVGLHKYIRPLMRPSTRALMTFARRSLVRSNKSSRSQ